MNDADKLFSTVSPDATMTADGYLLIPAPFCDDGTVEMYLTSSFDIIHVPTKTLYKRDPSIAVEDLVYTGIPNLGIDGGDVDLTTLLCAIYKPLGLPYSVYRLDGEGNYTGPIAKLLQGEWRDNPDQLFWQFPEGGIPVENETSYFYVPGVADAWVSANGAIFTPSKAVFQKGQNRELYAVLSSANPATVLELSKNQLAAFAFGQYDETTYLDEPNLVDEDSSPTTANIIASYLEVSGYTTSNT